ncbi:UvrD-helicase domain-containing protein [Streptomyces sp. NPDC046275]|uniref:UvrD-helicase domain-containing protein n=1 Tax=Streptomyces sp. NPDC046275 TaxID=3157201 RepID=UPI0033C1C94D
MRPPVLDASQRAVVEHTDGALLVLAGPGTGKTTTLVEAVAARVEAGADPERLLVLTFSRKAAVELRDRMAARLGGRRPPQATTFHSYCYALVRAHQDADLFAEPLRLLSGPEQDLAVRELLAGQIDLAKLGLGHVRWPDELRACLTTRGFADEVRAVIARSRELGLGPEALGAFARRVGRPDWGAAAGFLAEYLDVMDLQGVLDYTELVHRAVLLTESAPPGTLPGYDAVFVDEYQDTDPAQVRLLRGLTAGTAATVVAFGDPDQSIYAFRGADVNGILDFPATFGAAVRVLDTSRRSGAALLAATRLLTQRMPLPRLPADRVRAHRALAPVRDGGRVEVHTYPTPSTETDNIADLLRRAHLEDGVPWHDMAVLTRSAAPLPALRRALTSAGVPVETDAADTPLRHEPAVAPLLLALRAAATAAGEGASGAAPGAGEDPAGPLPAAGEGPGAERAAHGGAAPAGGGVHGDAGQGPGAERAAHGGAAPAGGGVHGDAGGPAAGEGPGAERAAHGGAAPAGGGVHGDAGVTSPAGGGAGAGHGGVFDAPTSQDEGPRPGLSQALADAAPGAGQGPEAPALGGAAPAHGGVEGDVGVASPAGAGTVVAGDGGGEGEAGVGAPADGEAGLGQGLGTVPAGDGRVPDASSAADAGRGPGVPAGGKGVSQGLAGAVPGVGQGPEASALGGAAPAGGEAGAGDRPGTAAPEDRGGEGDADVAAPADGEMRPGQRPGTVPDGDGGVADAPSAADAGRRPGVPAGDAPQAGHGPEAPAAGVPGTGTDPAAPGTGTDPAVPAADPDPSAPRTAADSTPWLDTETAVALLASPLGGMDPADLRRLGRALRDEERAGGNRVPAPSDVLLARAVAEPERLVAHDQTYARGARRLGELLRAARNKLAAGGTAEEALWLLWNGTPWPGRLERASLRGGPAGRNADRDLDAVCALFETAARAEDRVGGRGALNFLEELDAQDIAADTLTRRHTRPDAVRLMTAHRSKGLEWGLVVVAGVQEGLWPDLRRRGSLLEADRIGRDGLAEPLTPGALLAEERRLFYVAATRARDRLVVTAVKAPAEDGDQPSRFLTELGVEPKEVTGRPRRPLAVAALVAELRATTVDPAASPELRAAAAERLATLAALTDEDGNPLVPAAHPDRWWGLAEPTRSEVPLRDRDRPVALSGSALDQLAHTCALQWFLGREVKADAPATAAQGFGNVVHVLADEVASGRTPADLDVLMARLDSVWDALAFDAPWKSAQEKQNARIALERFLRWHVMDRGAGRTPAATEHEFDVTLGAGPYQVRIRGSMDRVEADEQGRAYVVDFKTGKSAPTRDEVAHHPQLAVYQLAVREGAVDEVFGGRTPEPGGAELVHLRQAAPKKEGGDALPKVQAQEPPDGEWIGDLLATAAGRVLDERFTPTAGQHCTTCSFRASCSARPEGRQVVE